MRLPSLCYEKAGKPMTFEVERIGGRIEDETILSPSLPTTLRPGPMCPRPVTRSTSRAWALLSHPAPRRGVKPDSPAARAGLKAGDVINAITIAPPPFRRDREGQRKQVGDPCAKAGDDHFRRGIAGLGHRVLDLQYSSTYDGLHGREQGSKPTQIKPEPDPDWSFPSRGLVFLPLIQKLPPQSIASALRAAATTRSRTS